MKKFLTIIGCALVAQIAHAQETITAQRIGSTTFFSNGVTAQQIGSTTFYSNGMTEQQIGSTTFYNNVPTSSECREPNRIKHYGRD